MKEELYNEPEIKDNEIENRKANKLNMVALIFYIITIINFFFNKSVNQIILDFRINELIQSWIFFIVGIAPLISFIIVIYVRLKYPKNIFAKILFIVIVLSAIILMIGGLMMFYMIFKSIMSWQ